MRILAATALLVIASVVAVIVIDVASHHLPDKPVNRAHQITPSAQHSNGMLPPDVTPIRR
jgi:hypothetical protein